MKNAILFMSLVLLFSCSETTTETIEDNTVDINLTSPNGIDIADSETTLKKEIEQEIWAEIGTEEAFEILNIEYLETRTETLALIEYKTVSGIQSNIGISIYNGNNRERVKYTVNCTGDCGCKVSGTITGNTISFACGCDDCTLEITSD